MIALYTLVINISITIPFGPPEQYITVAEEIE
jgi:hypothetical protein